MFSVAGMMDTGARRSVSEPGGSLVVLIFPPDFTVPRAPSRRNQDRSRCRKKSHPNVFGCVRVTIEALRTLLCMKDSAVVDRRTTGESELMYDELLAP
jgi:hypothetical protein